MNSTSCSTPCAKFEITMRFPYDPRQRPVLPLTLCANGRQHEATALVDSGADVNVLPWSIGDGLGFVWEPNKATIRVAGIANGAAMPVLLSADFGDVQGATLAFAWCQTDSVPLVLGQTNFFMEFDICFFKSRNEFQVVRKAA
jgi:hypothetical protein